MNIKVFFQNSKTEDMWKYFIIEENKEIGRIFTILCRKRDRDYVTILRIKVVEVTECLIIISLILVNKEKQKLVPSVSF